MYIVYLLALIVFGLVINTWRYRSRQWPGHYTKEESVADFEPQRLAAALKFQTISHQEADEGDNDVFTRFHAYLKEEFPRLHAQLKKEVISGYTLLYTWEGAQKDKNPILLLAHMDVVPVEQGTEETWEQPPFAGNIADGYIWGRGAMDDKSSLIAIMEAVEGLLATGFKPQRTVYLGFGHDEELGGKAGAAWLAAALKAKGVQLDLVLDEGGFITRGMVEGIEKPLAFVGTTEKGYASIELAADTEGGHSAMPPRKTAIGVLGRVTAELEEYQMPKRIQGPTEDMLRFLGPELPFFKRLALANLWLFRPFVARVMAKRGETNALVRTTTAPTIFQAGLKENILPVRARAVVNFRIAPGDSTKSVLAHVQKVAKGRVKASFFKGSMLKEPSPVADCTGLAFKTLQRTISDIFPGTVVAPYLVVGATDARYFQDLSPNVFRFMPLFIGKEDLQRVHGVNERIAVGDYRKMVGFYRKLLVAFQDTLCERNL